ncbi:MAG: hypothetical protein ACPGSC_14510 [Granulosicoccaceae bacterium]
MQLAYAAGDFEAVLSIDLDDGEDDAATDLYVAAKLAGADVAPAYQSSEETPAADSVDTFRVLVHFNAGSAKVGFDFSSNDALDAVNVSVRLAASTKITVIWVFSLVCASSSGCAVRFSLGRG